MPLWDRMNMIETITYENLPRGMGAVLGGFIRNSWMLQYSRPKIIGVRCGDLNIFDVFKDSTQPTSDLVLDLALANYTINMTAVLQDATKYGDGDNLIYEVTVLKHGTEFTTADLLPYIAVAENKLLVESLYTSSANDLPINIYIRETTSVISEEVNKSYLSEAGVTAPNVIPMASSNDTTSKVTYELHTTDISDSLVIKFEGTPEDYDDFKACMTEKNAKLLAKVNY